ncbi:SusC/RagA family TonB-linked outer membrane protein [Chitinophaga deserti]|uniref:SusC/RagA family TonB-linked outer membrane protein n=1 Tax=Chitinophaga deserti TaxID=2164099 RepID=UPI000D6D5570|nr:TonB-dependent receptor [Chitinophaga deserti]
MDRTIHIGKKARQVPACNSAVLKAAALCIAVMSMSALPDAAKARPAAVTASPLYAAIVVSGTVTDDEGAPMPGVVVAITGTSKAVITDASGAYIIKDVPEGASLTFKMVGYITRQVPANQAVINIKLEKDIKTLGEVVITDGYRNFTSSTSTGSINTVNGTSLENKPFANFAQSLQGQVAGLTAPITSGQPGANMDIRIRGVSSLQLSNNPLIVIDGMIVNSGQLTTYSTTSNALAGLNQNDIERIDVLKDAAATAVYGSRGAAGVILITTKRGKSGKTQIRVDAEGGVSSQIKLPKAGRLLNAGQYAVMFREALTNGGSTPTQVEDLANSYGLNSGKSNDWYDLITRTGKQQQYNVSLNGGGEKTKFFASAGYFGQEATTIGADMKRISGLLNLDHQINKRLQLSVGLNISNVGQNTPTTTNFSSNPIWAARGLRPFQLAYNDDGSINNSTSGNTNFPGIYNPLWTTENDKRFLSMFKALGNAKLRYNIWDKLFFTTYVSADYNTLEETTYLNPVMGDGGGTLKGRSRNYYSRFFNWLTRNQFDYRYDIDASNDFYVNASVGYEAQRSKEYKMSADGIGFPSSHPGLSALGNAGTPQGVYADYSNYAFVSTYGNASVNYKNKYALNASLRRDGSSRFASNNRYATFWSVGGTWNLHEEAFFQKQSVFSALKLRSSYGTTGNASLGNYQWLPQVSYGQGSSYGGVIGQAYNVIGNIDLTWETSRKFDVGADFGFANNRFMFSVDYYYNNIDGLIRSVPTSLTTGFGSVLQNVGAMANKGWEFMLRGDVIRTKNFTWNTNMNAALNRNEITKLPANTPVLNGNFYLKEGYSFNTFYMREYAGVDPQNGDPLYYTDETHSATTNKPGDAKMIPLDRLSVPKATGGFNNMFTYKGISLGIDFNFSLGYYILSSQDVYFTLGNYYINNKYQYIYDNRWTTPGQITDVPKFTTKSDLTVSTYRLYKGDHIRLKNIQLGYDFNNLAFVKRLGVSKLALYGRATNLFTKTFDKRLPFDPEVSYSGLDSQDMFQYKTFTIGINVGL